jgi:murein DD-endopeptidase MepM/ murein hydrolase activator NlpD
LVEGLLERKGFMRLPVAKNKDEYKRLWYNAQGFGVKTSYGYHEGDDYNLKTGGDSDLGQPIYAIADGVVTSLHDHTTKPTFGRHLHIKHDGPWGTVWSHYAHLLDIFVVPNQTVKEGQKIATLGKSGTNWAHLHFAIKKQPTGIDGIAKTLEDLKMWVDPIPFIEKWEGVEEVITPQTKIDLGDMGVLEVQAIRSELLDLRRDNENLKKHIVEIEKLIDQIIKEHVQL